MNYFTSRQAPTWSQPNPQSTRRSQIEIRLSARPPRYSQGDGPPPTPLSIVLKNDSTAQILDKRVMQGDPKNGELSLQLYYIVGWTDLPAARVAIQAQSIYDYVPPRVLEDFEYQLYLSREAQEEAEEEAAALEAVRQLVEAESGARPRKAITKRGPRPGRTRNRQRPSKADLIAKEQAAATSFNQTEAAHTSVVINESRSGVSLGAMPSLSTPKKKKPVPQTLIANSEDDIVVEEGSEMDVDDDDTTAIQRQLREETETRETQSHLTLQHYGFTPAARSKALRPALSQVGPTSEVSTLIKAEFQKAPEMTVAPNKANKQNRKKSKLVEPEEGEEEEPAVYEVKRLEGMKYEEIDGQVVRIFKVRWKGNWPPEDNPTWEPEENITPKLVKKYLAKRQQAGHDEPAPLVLPSTTTTTPRLKRKWSSVAEAFMGNVEEQAYPSSSGQKSLGSSNGGRSEIMKHQGGVVELDEDESSEDELLQVTERNYQHLTTTFRSKEFNDSLRQELETSF